MLLFTGSVLPRTTPQMKQSQFQYKYIASAFKHKCQAKKRHYVSLSLHVYPHKLQIIQQYFPYL